MQDVRQWIAVGPDGTELLISMWEPDADPEVAPRTSHTTWGPPLPVQPVTA